MIISARVVLAIINIILQKYKSSAGKRKSYKCLIRKSWVEASNKANLLALDSEPELQLLKKVILRGLFSKKFYFLLYYYNL